MLGAYHIFATDLLAGDVASLGAQTVQVSRTVHGVGLSRDGDWLYVTDVSDNRLVEYRIEAGRLTDERSVVVGAFPVHMVETLDLRYVFVTNFSGSSVSVVATQDWSVVQTISTPVTPHSIVLSPDGKTIYVACYQSHEVAILDVASQALIGTIAFPAQALPYGLAISANGRYIYASDNFGGRLYVANTVTRQVTTSIAIGKLPALIASAPTGRVIYVADGGSRAVSAVDITNPASPSVTATISVDGFPHGLSVTPDGRYVIVAGTSSGALSYIDTLTGTQLGTISGMRYPNDVITSVA
jgi:YVTN family beta-propeller protein